MIWRLRAPVLAATILAMAAPGWAQFNASDLIVIPVVAHNEGTEDSVWRSDVFITNVEPEASVDVMLVYAASGLRDNSYLFLTSNPRQYWVGGREEEGFGMIEETLADIPPNGTVVLEDVVGTYWPDSLGVGGGGALIIFAYEAGTLDAPDDPDVEDDGRIDRNVVVNSRTYNQTTVWTPDPDNDGEFLEEAATYGQVVPGVPWYNLIDAGAVSEANGDFSYQILLGASQNEDFRFNVGLFNASDLLTTLTVRIKPYGPDGLPYVDEITGTELSLVATLPPLAQLQYNSILAVSFGLDDVTPARVEVGIVGFSSGGINVVPLLACYGSMVDNHSNDPTTILPVFEAPYNVDCIWPPDEEDEPVAEREDFDGQGEITLRRPFDPPPRLVD